MSRLTIENLVFLEAANIGSTILGSRGFDTEFDTEFDGFYDARYNVEYGMGSNGPDRVTRLQVNVAGSAQASAQGSNRVSAKARVIIIPEIR